MTMRNRQLLVAAGLIVLVLWALSAWFGSTAPAEPTPGSLSDRRDRIRTAHLRTERQRGSVLRPPRHRTGAPAGHIAGLQWEPGLDAAPRRHGPPAPAVRWTGTWTNTSPDNATGSLEIVWTQNGSALQGDLTMSGVACFTAGGIQGTVDGNAVTFQVLLRDEVEFEGTIAGDRVSGTFSVSCDGSEGTWEATRQR